MKPHSDRSFLYSVWEAVNSFPGWLRFLGNIDFTENQLEEIEILDDEISSTCRLEEKLHYQWLKENLPKNHAEALRVFPEAEHLVKKSIHLISRWRFKKDEIEEANSSDIARVIDHYVKLKKVGVRFFGICPFHHEKHPSFTVYAESNTFHCFGCGARGGTITFLMKIENLSFKQAVRALLLAKGRI